MGFLKTLGKIGRIAAPIAASFIPGVGPLAAMAIGGGLGAADKKLSGGSWKDALISGGIGAGTGYLGAKIPGIGPSDGVVKNAVSGTANKALGQGGVKGALGSIAKKTGASILQNGLGGNTPPALSQVAMTAQPRPGQMPSQSAPYNPVFGPTFGPDQNNPNLANAINQGKMDAMNGGGMGMIPLQRRFGRMQ